MLTIRPAEPNDFDELAAVWHSSVASMDALTGSMPSHEELKERITIETGSSWDLFVAEKDDAIVGMLALKPADFVLDQLFVAPHSKRTGVGSALLTFAKKKLPGGFNLRMAAANRSAALFYECSGLQLSHEGTHPRSGEPVHFYSWQGG